MAGDYEAFLVLSSRTCPSISTASVENGRLVPVDDIVENDWIEILRIVSGG
ncbi:MAG: hypothetical protein KAR76_06625 [Methanosarcinales archaeon]|nr:hypothetical protein [Methanosarcinales archaeon]